MGLPRRKYVREGQEGVYHCFSRCVRRAFLCGFDSTTGRDFSHRKAWLVERLRELAAIFAIEILAYAVMETHYHNILRTRPDLVATWSDREVAIRWLKLFPRHRGPGGAAVAPAEEEICALADDPERIAKLRLRLSSLSWFMGRLNEFIARAANKEDGVKGRFWEGRFKCQTLLDEAAIAACMVYVDLNPIRAGLAETPEGSHFTSVQERIRAWQKETSATTPLAMDMPKETPAGSGGKDMRAPQSACGIANCNHERASASSDSTAAAAISTSWLCPIQSDLHQRGILRMTTVEYFDLVDKSGRLTRLGKPGRIDADLAPILQRIGAKPEAWVDTISCFGCKFRLAAGTLTSMRGFAYQLGRRWLTGIAVARAAFA